MQQAGLKVGDHSSAAISAGPAVLGQGLHLQFPHPSLGVDSLPLWSADTSERCSSSLRQASGGSFLSQGLKGSETTLTLIDSHQKLRSLKIISIFSKSDLRQTRANPQFVMIIALIVY